MRALHVVQPVDGGVAEHVLQLALGLARHGIEVEAAAPAESVLHERLRGAGLVTHVVPMVRAPSPSDLAAARQVRALARAGRYDVVHAHSSKAGVLVRVGLRDRRRLVYTAHCPAYASQVGNPLVRHVYRAAEQALLPRTGIVIAVSEWEARVLARGLVGAARRTRVVRNGVPPCGEAPLHAQLAAFARGHVLVGTVTGLRPGKEVGSLVRAARLLADRGLEGFRVAVVGSGPLEGALHTAIAAEGMAGRVAHFPFRPPVGQWLRALDAFVLPTLWESLPLSVLEAMRCGLPVVASDVGGVGEAVVNGETGLVVPPGDDAALADAIGALVLDGERRQALGRAARERADALFSVERMVADVAALYQELLAADHRV